ncbi:cytochrome P450 [Streptomyces sp. NBC_00237]|uniref:cytochrome P450 n=1 Tax=Streptomyces sp. NBC_00237 TaxID=2975687 RepID=UPI0022509A20|nr:cytochrome P450 [Streptomyces sp. NBC_00237]MCX5205723.1 cytochrome P450 [Streptomyces sp. NBC_00237]
MDAVAAPLSAPPAPRGVIRRLQSRQGREDPFPLFEEIRQVGPVVSLGRHALLVTGYKECAHILSDRIWQVPDQQWRTARGVHTDGSSIGVMATLPRLNPPVHSRLRHLLAAPFTQRALTLMLPTVRDLVHHHLDTLEAELRQHGRAEFMSTVARALPVAVMCAILGLPAKDMPLIAHYSIQTAPLTEPFATPAQITAADEAAGQFHAYIMALMTAPGPHPGDGLLTRWRTETHPARDTTSNGDLAANVVFLLGAGVETTSSLFATALTALERHPRQAAWLTTNPQAWPQAVEELMRWDPSVHNAVRFPAQDTVLAGIEVPAGTLVHALIAAANRDPEHFPAPHDLDFHRPPKRSLAFGAGPHYCLGAPLARLNALELLPELLRRFPTLRTDGPAVRAAGINLRTVITLPVSHRPSQPTIPHP